MTMESEVLRCYAMRWAAGDALGCRVCVGLGMPLAVGYALGWECVWAGDASGRRCVRQEMRQAGNASGRRCVRQEMRRAGVALGCRGCVGLQSVHWAADE